MASSRNARPREPGTRTCSTWRRLPVEDRQVARSATGLTSGPPRSGIRPEAPSPAGRTRRSATSRTSIGGKLVADSTGTFGLCAGAASITTTRSWNWVVRSTVHGCPDSDSSTGRSPATLSAGGSPVTCDRSRRSIPTIDHDDRSRRSSRRSRRRTDAGGRPPACGVDQRAGQLDLRAGRWRRSGRSRPNAPLRRCPRRSVDRRQPFPVRPACSMRALGRRRCGAGQPCRALGAGGSGKKDRSVHRSIPFS